MEKINIALVDDQVLFRKGIASLIKDESDLSLVMEADDGESCLAQLSQLKELPGVAIIDMEMPGMDGMQLNDELHKHFPSIKTIVLSVHTGERLMARMIQAGACGYLFKNCDKDELLNAIRNVSRNGFYITPAVLKAIQSPMAGKGPVTNSMSIPIEISPREIEVLRYICMEYTNTEIAERLFISSRTVDGHRNNLLAKTGCRNTAGLVLFAVKHRFFEVVY
ncbi:MAG: response regulator transcription factor, partial [Chitinophagaceae bacterium]|nr:response regulator transcription factor [Chitinophagaceae bacterium]